MIKDIPMAALIADKLKININKKIPNKLFTVIVAIVKKTPNNNNNNSKIINKKIILYLTLIKLVTKSNIISSIISLFKKIYSIILYEQF